MSEPLRRALATPASRPILVAVIELPDGTVYLSDAGVEPKIGVTTSGSANGGGFGGVPKPVVESWGSVSTGIQARGESLQRLTVSLQIADPDRWWNKKTSGPYALQLRGSAFTIWMGAAGVAFPDWYPAFRGVLQSWSLVGTAAWTLVGGPSDQWLRGFVPRHPITTADYPLSSAQVMDQYIAVVYGKHSTAGLGGGGAYVCPLVNSQTFSYLVGLGGISVDTVYVSGEVVSSGYSVARPTRGGKTVTEVTFTADQGTAEVRVDVRGYDDVGDGTGTLIENPVDVLMHLVTNFGRGDWRSGAWGTPDAELLDMDGLSLCRAYFETFGIKNSKILIGRERLADVISSWAVSNYVKPFWTHDGKLSVVPLDHRPLRRYLGASWWVRGWAEEHGEFRPSSDDTGVRDEVALDYMAIGDGTKQTLRVRLPDEDEYSSDNVKMDWSYGDI